MFGKKKKEKKKDDGYEYISGVGAVPTGDPRWQGAVYPPPEENPAFLQNYFGASGSSYDVSESYLNDIYRPPVPEHTLHLENPRSHNLEFDVEALWEKMYEHAMAVIVVCDYCGVPQAISNGTCMQCGGALPKPKPLGSKT